MEASLPKDEAARLATLRSYAILDTPRETDFDDLVKLAAQICQTPISLVSLVDRDRQWFKGRYGLEVSQTPRRLSFCAHSILNAPATTVVPDATQDKRFADNELVTGEPGIRFYAGTPLVSPEGQALGTLCVIDRKPRRLTDEQLEALRILGRQVLVQMELRRRLAELEQKSSELAFTLGELESFSYSLSHDMRAPLRAIKNFSGIALQGNEEKIGQVGVSCLHRVVNAAERLDHLVTDVLAFSRVSRDQVKLEVVDLDRVVRHVVQERLELQPPKATVQVRHPLGRAMGNEACLTQCVANLLSNAVTYVAPGVQPNVRVYAEHNEDKTRLVVADNGIGVPPEAKEEIFNTFQRLHSAAEYEGTGLGLAIVKRAVLRMGGRVGVESREGEGSRFWVELREAPPGEN